MTTLDDEILDKLGCKTIKQLSHLSTSGCVNVGHVYLLDNERKIFVKKNNDPISDVMFKGKINRSIDYDVTSLRNVHFKQVNSTRWTHCLVRTRSEYPGHLDLLWIRRQI